MNAVSLGERIAELEIDHLCIRSNSAEEFESYKNLIEMMGATEMSANIVNGRVFYTYRLNEPIEIFNRRISDIELPSPGKKTDWTENFEHVEFLIDIKVEIRSELELKEAVAKALGIELEELDALPNLFVSIPQSEGNKVEHYALGFKSEDGSTTIKFTNHSLAKVVGFNG